MKNSKNRSRRLRRWVLILAVVLAACLAVLAYLQMTQPSAIPDETTPSAAETTGLPAPTQAAETTEATETTAPTETTGATAATEATKTTEATEATEAATEPRETTPQPTAPAPTTTPTQPTQPQKPENPDDLTAMLAAAGHTYDELTQKNCTQLVTVVASGNKAQIRFFTLTDGLWEEASELHTSGFVGRNGVSKNKKEGDGCTPEGLYSIGTGFYISKQPETDLELFQITADTYWVDDPKSAYYNQRVEGTENKDWNSAEKMGSYKTAYKYGFVVDYNTDCVPGDGSAIFFHVGSKATAGCIATKEKQVLSYLSRLNVKGNPHILIISEKDLAS